MSIIFEFLVPETGSEWHLCSCAGGWWVTWCPAGFRVDRDVIGVCSVLRGGCGSVMAFLRSRERTKERWDPLTCRWRFHLNTGSVYRVSPGCEERSAAVFRTTVRWALPRYREPLRQLGEKERERHTQGDGERKGHWGRQREGDTRTEKERQKLRQKQEREVERQRDRKRGTDRGWQKGRDRDRSSERETGGEKDRKAGTNRGTETDRRRNEVSVTGWAVVRLSYCVDVSMFVLMLLCVT